MLLIKTDDSYTVLTLDPPRRLPALRTMRVYKYVRDVEDFEGRLVTIPGDDSGRKYTLAASFQLNDNDTAELKKNL
jgi:hypothetical protein